MTQILKQTEISGQLTDHKVVKIATNKYFVTRFMNGLCYSNDNFVRAVILIYSVSDEKQICYELKSLLQFTNISQDCYDVFQDTYNSIFFIKDYIFLDISGILTVYYKKLIQINEIEFSADKYSVMFHQNIFLLKNEKEVRVYSYDFRNLVTIDLKEYGLTDFYNQKFAIVTKDTTYYICEYSTKKYIEIQGYPFIIEDDVIHIRTQKGIQLIQLQKYCFVCKRIIDKFKPFKFNKEEKVCYDCVWTDN